MAHDESSGNAQAPVTQCTVCGQTLPLSQPCDTPQCQVRTAAEMRTAAAKAAFRLGC